MHIAVVGAGAVGSVLAGCLADAGQDVVLVGRTGPPAPEPGVLELRGPGQARSTVRLQRLSSAVPLPGALDAVIMAVKRFDLPDALAALRAVPGVPAVTAQNGIGAEELVAERRPGAGLVAASLTAAARLGPGGEAHWLNRGGIGLAAVEGPVDALVSALADAFRAGGMRAVVYPDARAMKWSKLLGNLVGNATSALLDLDVAAVYADPRLYDVERRQVLEARAVMATLGLAPVALPGADVRLLLRVFRLPAIMGRPILSLVLGGVRGGKPPSLRLALQEGGGRTEVAWLNGAVASTAASLGLDAPVNATLARLVEEAALDPERRAWFRGHPDRLLASLVVPLAGA
ncbi:MAG: ketopantoate reductase family protein [Candidatus Limnocylindrales bacterium]